MILVGLTALLLTLVLGGGAAWFIGNGDETSLGAEDLQSYPDIVLVWGPTNVGGGTGDLYVVRADGTGVRAIRKWPTTGELREDQPYGAQHAVWAPNRESIALDVAVWADSDPRSRIALMDHRGRGFEVLTPRDDVSLDAWSVDEARLIARYAGGYGTFFTVPVAGGPRKPLRIAGARHLGLVAWSPDGSRIAATLRNGATVTMNADGSDVTPLTRDGGRPVWSPDGRSILFTRGTYNEETDEYTSDVYRIGADGRGEQRLTDDESSEGLDWSPDGKLVLFRRCCEAAEAKPNTEGRTLWVMDAQGKRQTRLPFNKEGWDVLSADWGG